MQRSLLQIVPTFVFFILLGGLSTQTFAEGILLLTDNRPLFEGIDRDGNSVECSRYIVECAIEASHIPFKIAVVPWKRAQKDVREGKATAFFLASRNEARDQYGVLSDVVIDQHWNWYYIDTSISKEGLVPHSKYRIGSWQGSNSLQWLVDNGYNVSSRVKNASILAKLLISRRIDVAFCSNVAMEKALRELGVTEDIHVYQGPAKPMGVYFAREFIKLNPHFMETFNRNVKICRGACR